MSSIDKDTRDISTGPFTFDLELARAAGFTEEECVQASEMHHVFALGVLTWRAKRAGFVCEHCGRHASHLPGDCVTCNNTGRPDYMAEERERRERAKAAAEELKPCPLCGAKRTVTLVDGFHRGFYAECTCGVRGPERYARSEAIDAWNTRPAETL